MTRQHPVHGRGSDTPARISVLLLTTSYPLDAGSVSGIFVQRLAAALDRHCALRVLAPADATASPADAVAPFATTFRYAPRGLQTLAHGAGGIPAALGARRANLLLVPPFLLAMLVACWRHSRGTQILFANWSICGIAAGLAGRARGIPVVVTLRGEDANRVDKGRLFRTMLGLCARLCDRVVTVSEAMADALRISVPAIADKLVTIPNGVAQDFLEVQPARSDTGALRLLCVASLIPRKSVGTLIRALAALPGHYTLSIVGEGSEESALRQLADTLGVTRRVRFLPFQPPERLPALLAECDIFVLPSLAEGRPNVVLEAFAAARPVVASDIDGLRELIGADVRGLLFARGNVEGLSDCLLRLGDPAIRAMLGERARQFIIDEGLTWDRAAERYTQLFQELLTHKRMSS